MNKLMYTFVWLLFRDSVYNAVHNFIFCRQKASGKLTPSDWCWFWVFNDVVCLALKWEAAVKKKKNNTLKDKDKKRTLLESQDGFSAEVLIENTVF